MHPESERVTQTVIAVECANCGTLTKATNNYVSAKMLLIECKAEPGKIQVRENGIDKAPKAFCNYKCLNDYIEKLFISK